MKIKIIISLIIIVLILCFIYYKCHDSYYNAIKTYAYMHGFTVSKDFDAEEGGYYMGYGQQFGVKGINTKQGPLSFFYLRKGFLNMWFVESCGSGP